MTEDHSALLTLLTELHDTTESDRTRRITQRAYRQLVDAEAAHVIGAARYERTEGLLAHRVVSRAVVIATGVTGEGHREVLGIDVGDSEEEAFWKTFLTSLEHRGPSGVAALVISVSRKLAFSSP